MNWQDRNGVQRDILVSEYRSGILVQKRNGSHCDFGRNDWHGIPTHRSSTENPMTIEQCAHTDMCMNALQQENERALEGQLRSV